MTELDVSKKAKQSNVEIEDIPTTYRLEMDDVKEDKEENVWVTDTKVKHEQ